MNSANSKLKVDSLMFVLSFFHSQKRINSVLSSNFSGVTDDVQYNTGLFGYP